MLKVGIIGLGKMGQLHFMNSLRMGNVEVIAVADRSRNALSKAGTNGVEKRFSDYRELLAQLHGELDAVVISLPNFLHFESSKSALENGINVFLEKPMATRVDECRQLVNLTKKHGKVLMPGHSMRFIDAISQMKTLKDEGRIGDLEVVTLEELLNGPFTHGANPSPVPEWWFDPTKTGGGVLLDLGYHLIDLFRFFTTFSAA